MITRGLEAAQNGMQSLLIQQDVIANNLANVNTVGFKKTNVTFKDIMDVRVEVEKVPYSNNPKDSQFFDVGSLSLGSEADRTYIDFSQGSLIQTGNNFDLAIQGDGFFKIRKHEIVSDKTPYKEENHYYTRSGNFHVTDENYLVTKDGDWVMDEQNKRIKISLNQEEPKEGEVPNSGIDYIKEVAISPKGQIQVANPENPVYLQTLYIADFQDKTQVSYLGEDRFIPAEGYESNLTKGSNFELQQGALEGSNTNTIAQMINTINVTRSYEAMGKIVKTQGDTVTKAINIGTVTR